MRLEDAMDSLSTSKQAVVRRRTVPSRRRRDGLIHYASNTTSQHGEDGILKRLFALLPTSNNYGTDRWCVDVGAWDGVHWSNTNSLLQPPSKEDHDDTWRGVLIEADVAKFQQLCQLYAYCSSTPNEVCCLNVTVTVDRDSATTSLHEILRNQQQHKNQPSQEQPESIANNENCASSSAILPSSTLPDHFDFLCIDIDGNDYWVLHDLWEFSSFRPTVVCVEFNPTMPDDLIYIPPRNDRIRHVSELQCKISWNLIRIR